MSAEESTKLKSSIGHHSDYIWETKVVLEECAEVDSYDELRRRVVEDNILNKGSEDYRKKMLGEIRRRSGIGNNEIGETALIQLANSPSVSESVLEWIIYYHYSQDSLVKTLTQEFLYPKYESGILSVSRDDVVEFIDSLEDEYPEVEGWTENTKEDAASHYLTALKKFGILEGKQNKQFRHIYAPDEAVAYVLYSLFDEGLSSIDEVVSSDEWLLLFLEDEEVRDRIMDISPTYVEYEKRGSVERLEPKYDSLKEVVDDF
jgi:hypothetical protein